MAPAAASATDAGGTTSQTVTMRTLCWSCSQAAEGSHGHPTAPVTVDVSDSSHVAINITLNIDGTDLWMPQEHHRPDRGSPFVGFFFFC